MWTSKIILFISSTLLVVVTVSITASSKNSTAQQKIVLNTPTQYTNDTLPKNMESAIVTRVVDGDTIEINHTTILRYIGINTPETIHPYKSVECFGYQATKMNKQLVLNQSVLLEKDISETDRYGRALRYVYIQDPDNPNAWLMVNHFLVEKGYAYASAYPPDIKYQKQLELAEETARKQNNGLWANCLDETEPVTQNYTACIIKGNINSKGYKIFHIPECISYDDTRINKEKGERYFCTESEAETAGWTKAKNCP